MESLIRTNFFLSKAERERLQKLAHKQRISSAELLRRVLDAYLGISPKPVEAIRFSHEVSRK
jgi:Ribbon-helix-helix protein, copG family